ncbi:hypothetical protein XM38_019580 [Halomicronema hongdechloris C2206]|uniref:Uncharacterized protein n=1 Tax=Halomicronema hongdechloris C2206 TaxID=1641165 RepID=A0A1Z3HL15_9CYAN|nr:hypothetical protein XM38_019580 [Halomicronema hongdechloris C2206]
MESLLKGARSDRCRDQISSWFVGEEFMHRMTYATNRLPVQTSFEVTPAPAP